MKKVQDIGAICGYDEFCATQQKNALNNDFKMNAKIHGIASIIYYPSIGTMLTHSEFEFEGRCYSHDSIFGYKCMFSLDKRVRKIRRDSKNKMSALSFYRIDMKITPNAIEKIRAEEGDYVYNKAGWTCTNAVMKVVERYNGVKGYFPFNVSPTLNALYIFSCKKLVKSDSVGEISLYKYDRSRAKLVVDAVSGIAIDLLMTSAFISYLSYNVHQRLSKPTRVAFTVFLFCKAAQHYRIAKHLNDNCSIGTISKVLAKFSLLVSKLL